MNRLSLARSLAAVALGGWLLATAVAAEDLDPKAKVRLRRFQRVTAPIRHLVLRGGRSFYRGPRLLRNVYPYWAAANDAERAKGYGYELRLGNAHQLFEPIGTEAQARELARLLSGGELVPDEAAYTALRAEALRLKPSATGWGIKLSDGRPGCFGIQAERAGQALRVRMLVFTCSGLGRLAVEERTYAFPANRPSGVKTRIWIAGPPQSWQTSGDVDPNEEAALRAEVKRFRLAMLKVLHRHRTIAHIKAAIEDRPTFATIRARLGEPDEDRGHGLHIYVYRLGDGTAALFGVPDEDAGPMWIRHVDRGRVDDPEAALPGRVIEDLTPASGEKQERT